MMMPYAVRVHEIGSADKLNWEEIQLKAPGPGEVLVRNTAIGLNFIDTYYRSGLYHTALPFIPGSEGAGVIEAVGSKVREFKIGDRVAYVDPMGAYSEFLLRPTERLVKLPSYIEDKLGAAIMLKGLTAHYLLKRTYKLKHGETVLVHAAAGGVGQILCQWAKYLGAIVIGTVGTEEKAKIAKKAGCKYVIVTSLENFPEEVKKITKGKGVPVVYDGVGKDTFMDSLNCLSPLGLMVSFGNASGAVPAFEIGTLAKRGSLFLTRPTLGAYISKREDLMKAAHELFSVVKKGAVKISINQSYSLSQAALAHRDLESRKTTGSTVLLP